MPYSTDDDLEKVSWDILSQGTKEWESQHIKAEIIINRDLNVRWYKDVAKEKGVDDKFDKYLLSNKASFKDASVYKVLELIYLSLIDNAQSDDTFAKKTEFFKSMYEEEIGNVISEGIYYDWDENGHIDEDEKEVESEFYNARLLVR